MTLYSGSTSGLPWDACECAFARILTLDYIDNVSDVLNVTSGTWLTPADSTCSLWTHTVVVIVPRVLSPSLSLDHAAIYITGGSSSSGIPSPNNGDIMTGESAGVRVRTHKHPRKILVSRVSQLLHSPLIRVLFHQLSFRFPISRAFLRRTPRSSFVKKVGP